MSRQGRNRSREKGHSIGGLRWSASHMMILGSQPEREGVGRIIEKRAMQEGAFNNDHDKHPARGKKKPGGFSRARGKSHIPWVAFIKHDRGKGLNI